jgi:chromatin segregation and condensation protein Rec8/ScpA/Scc1 (kleisin family)
MQEEKILDFITSEYSWEQVVYKIIAWEGLDPWNLDLKVLSKSFLDYVAALKSMDFKIPAKYIIIASVLLRMKADHLQYLGDLVQGEYIEPGMEGEAENGEMIDEEIEGSLDKFEINPISVPPHRQPRRKIVVDELMRALKSALRTSERRALRKSRRRKKISIRDDNISARISSLYQRINDMLSRIKKDEVKFRNVVNKWEKKEVVDSFMPLVFLDHQKKVHTRQEEMFEEIYIKKREN